MLKIALGSMSSVKEFAVLHAVITLEINSEITAIKCSSDVPNQPFEEETVSGATNRALAAHSAYPNRLSIGIESGLFELPDHTWVDRSIVVFVRPDGSTLTVHSEDVGCPEWAVLKALAARRCGQDITAGKIIAEKLGCAHDDWYTAVHGSGTKTRFDILVETLVKHLPSLLL